MLRPYWKWAGLVVAVLFAGCASVKYSLLVTEQKLIPQVSVKVSYIDNGIYQVEVDSKLPDAITLQWNSSAYLNTSGGTVRIIHIEDVDTFPEQTPVEQEPSAIVHAKKLKTYFVGESWIDYARRGVTPKPRDSVKKAMIYLAFDIDGKRVYWKGEVSFQAAKR